MKFFATLILLTLSLNGFSQTQAEMNKEALADYVSTDKQLNEIYQAILSEYQSDAVFIENLKKSQRLWIQFRDAEMEVKYPNYPDQIYGSIQPVCSAYYIKDLTDQRIQTLKTWIRGIEEGDLCSGSVKFSEEMDPQDMAKAYIKKDGSIWMSANMQKDYRIFGYATNDIYSEKMILLSIFTNDVKYNLYNCKYGAFYDTQEMSDLKLTYLAIENEFVKIAIMQDGDLIDEIYMLKECFEFEQ